MSLVNAFGFTALQFARTNGHTETAQMLLDLSGM